MTASELDLVAPSLRAFQRGESSEGRHLLASARRAAERAADPAWYEAIALHVREEQRHAALLERVLRLHGQAPLEGYWADGVFRVLRKLSGGLGAQVVVLASAEMLAMTYYLALREATASSVVRAVCARILADEVAHLRFQAENLSRLLMGRSRAERAAVVAALRTVHGGAAAVLWIEHGQVLRAGGFDVQGYVQHVRRWRRAFEARVEVLL